MTFGIPIPIVNVKKQYVRRIPGTHQLVSLMFFTNRLLKLPLKLCIAVYGAINLCIIIIIIILPSVSMIPMDLEKLLKMIGVAITSDSRRE